MSAISSLVQSTIGQKVLMAGTGLVMVGWLFLHMSGNMLVFLGPESFNHYAEFIQSGFGVEPALLWAMRAFMLASIVLHVWSAIRLTARNQAARPDRYAAGAKTRTTSYAARFMALGGMVILAYLVFHLLHLTVGSFDVDFQGTRFERGNAYKNLVIGLSNPVVTSAYIVANLALGAHLYHGVTSGFQTLGWSDPGYAGVRKALGLGVPGLIAGGNLLIAIAIVLGLVQQP